MIMGIDQELPVLAVPRQMDLEDPLRRYRRQVVEGIETVIVRTHKDVVHIEQDSTVRMLRDASEKLPLRHGVFRIGEVGGHILEGESAA